MKKVLLLLALLLTATSHGQNNIMNPSTGGFSKTAPDLDLPAPPAAEPAIEPTILRQERILVPAADVHKKWEPAFANIDQWIAWIKKPEYRLISSQQGKAFYAAVFLADGRNVVLASHSISGDAADQSYNAEMRIDRANGADAADWKHRKLLQINCILHTPDGDPDTNYPYDVGWLVPIKKGYKGPLHVVIEKWKQGEKEMHPILDAAFNWPVAKNY